jgi:VCBS repeat-containing protein
VDGPSTVNSTTAAGSFGTFTISSAGAWTYVSSSAVDQFDFGTISTDTFAVTATDGTIDSVTVSIRGTDVSGLSNSTLAAVNFATVSSNGISGSYTIDNTFSAAQITELLTKTSTFNSSVSVDLASLDESQEQAVQQGLSNLTAASAGVGGFAGTSSSQDLSGLWSSAFVTVNLAASLGSNTTLSSTQAGYLADADIVGLAQDQALTINSSTLSQLSSLTGVKGTTVGSSEVLNIADNDSSASTTTIDLITKLSSIQDLDSINIFGDTRANVIQLSEALSTSGKVNVYLSGGNESTVQDGVTDRLIFNVNPDDLATTGSAVFNQIYGFSFSGTGSDKFGIYTNNIDSATAVVGPTAGVLSATDLTVAESTIERTSSSVPGTIQDLRSTIATDITQVNGPATSRFEYLSYYLDNNGTVDAYLSAVIAPGGTSDLSTSTANFAVKPLAQFNTTVEADLDLLVSTGDLTNRGAAGIV